MLLGSQHLLTVTAGGLLYRNGGGQVGWVDFKLCHRRWRAAQGGADDAGYIVGYQHNRIVGERNTPEAIWLDVAFYTEPVVRFEFRSYALRDTLLLEPMRAFGWVTQDILAR